MSNRGTSKQINKYILFRQRGHRDSDMSYKNIITWAKINPIRLWEPLEIETIQPKKDMKYAKEFVYAGHMLPILITYMIIHYTLTYWGIILSTTNPTHIRYSLTYPSVETGDMHRYWQWQWQYCWGKLLLCSSSCSQICGTPNWYGQLHSSQMPYSSWCIWGH